MAEQRLHRTAIDDRVDFNQKRAMSGRRAGVEVHRPDSVAPTARNVRSKKLIGGRAIRAQTGSSPQKIGRLDPAISDRVDLNRKRAKDGRRAAGEVHQPDTAARNVTKESSELATRGRAVRRRPGSKP